MAEEKPTHEQVADLLNRWNKPPEDNALSRLVGDQGEKRDPVMDHDRNPGLSGVDAERMFTDDGDDEDAVTDDLPEVPVDDDGNPDYDSMKNDDLKQHLSARDLPVSGKHADLVARLEEDDESDDDEDDDDE